MTENNLEVVKKELNAREVFTDEAWEHLIDELRDIIVEGVTGVRERVIEMKWQIGDRLLEEGEEKITPLLKRVSVEIRLSERDLWHCLAFRKKYPTLKEMWDTVPEGKNISWHKLVNNYIDFQIPKPELPIDDKYDDWGIIEWWKKKNPGILHLRDRNSGFTLIIREAKIRAEMIQPIKVLYEELTKFYIQRKKWNEKDLGHDDYNRIHRALKQLLEKAKGDKEKVKKAISWCYVKYRGSQIDWVLETVIKKYPEAMK